MTITSNRGFKSKTTLYMSLFFLLFSLFTSNLAQAVTKTYYLTSAGQDFANEAASWNDSADGSGSDLPDFSFANIDTTILIIPIGISGTLDQSFSMSGANTSSTKLIIYGSLRLPEVTSISFSGASNSTPGYIVNVFGTIIFEELATGQIISPRTTSRMTFTLESGATVVSYNENGIYGISANGQESIRYRTSTGLLGSLSVTFSTGSNFEFVGTCGTKGMPASVNNIDISGGGITTLFSNVTVNGTLTIANGDVFDLDASTLTIPTAFAPTTGTISLNTGTLSVSGNFTHTSSTDIDFGSGNLIVTGSLVMTSGTLKLGTGNLTCNSTVSRTTGRIYGPSGTMTFTNASAVTLPSNLFLTYPANMVLNGAGGITLGGKTSSLTDSVGSVTFSNGNLTLTGDTTAFSGTTGSGGFIVSNSSATIKFYGSGSFTSRVSQTSPGTTNSVKNIILRGTCSVVLGNALRLVPNGLVDIGSGTTLSTDGFLTIVSNSAGHGRIGTVSGTLTSSSSDSIQLYIPGGTRGYRLFGNPFTSALAISQFMNSATEIDVTGTGGSGNGFTTTINNNPSAYSYNTSGNTWDAYTSTSQTIPVGFGAHILVRGIKGQGLDGLSYTPSAVTIRLAGQLRSGSVITTLSDAGFGWNLVANPYPSNIHLNQISGANWSNVNNLIYGYDKVNKTYSACNKNGSNAVNNLSNIIEMGSSFLVEVNAAGAASITFTENIKTDSSSTVGGNPIFTPKDERTNRFKLQLYGLDENKMEIHDECLFSFGNVSTATDDWDASTDAWDLGGEIVDIGIVGKKKNLAINEYPNLSTYTKTIHLNVFGKFNGTYKIGFTEESPIESGIDLFLRDKFKGEVHNINDGIYTFEINDNELSYGSERFELFSNVTSNVQKIKSQNEIKIFPNPLTSSATEIDVFIAGEGHSFIIPRIYDLSGRLIFEGSKTFVSINKTNKITLPLNLNAQNYILTCETAQGIFNQQLTITE